MDEREDTTLYIDRSKVREIVIGHNAATQAVLSKIDALQIFTAGDFRASAQQERPSDVQLDAAYANGVRACLRRLEHLRASDNDGAFAECEVLWRNRVAERHASLSSTDRLPPSETDGLLSGDYPLPIEHYERVARNLAAVWSNGNDGARTCILAALLKAAAPVETSRLELLLREYARDLRRNSGGGDDYPWEWAKAAADYLETLIDRASALTPAEGKTPTTSGDL